jgi:hypothetical protein
MHTIKIANRDGAASPSLPAPTPLGKRQSAFTALGPNSMNLHGVMKLIAAQACCIWTYDVIVMKTGYILPCSPFSD